MGILLPALIVAIVCFYKYKKMELMRQGAPRLLENGERRKLEERIDALEQLIAERELDPEHELNLKFKKLEARGYKV